MSTTPIVLVPGFWLGAWAWDEVAAALRVDGHEVTALTLPGLESIDTDRSLVTLADHVDAICDAVTAAGRPVDLAVHSGARFPWLRRERPVPELIAAMVYVDTGPGIGAMEPDFEGVEMPLPPREAPRRRRGLDGLSRSSFSRPSSSRRCPSRVSVLRGAAVLTIEARLGGPTSVIATRFPSALVPGRRAEGLGVSRRPRRAPRRGVGDLPASHWRCGHARRSSPRPSAASPGLVPALTEQVPAPRRTVTLVGRRRALASRREPRAAAAKLFLEGRKIGRVGCDRDLGTPVLGSVIGHVASAPQRAHGSLKRTTGLRTCAPWLPKPSRRLRP